MYYFAYGSNLSKKQMSQCCPQSKPYCSATLPNYQIVFSGYSRVWHGGVATVKLVRGKKVPGAVYEVSEECQRRLDKFEGHPDSYLRTNIRVFDEDGQVIDAFTYIKAGAISESTASADYLAVIRQGYRDWALA